ncbi:MAG: M23 family metallopeptidase [Promethearchaeota archaeon]
MVAAREGFVTAAINDTQDDQYGTRPYGNYVEIDHGSGYVTRYAHLSHYGFAVSEGQYVHRGQRLANADNTGKSDAAHLHFEVRVNSTAVDPYAGNTHWVARDPIPMGYRDQNGTIYGPYSLDHSAIRLKWLSLDGAPGSPLGNDYVIYVAAAGATAQGRRQDFEHGYLQWLPGQDTTYHVYAKTYLPDAKAILNDWTSFVMTRNNGPQACLNVTLYDSEGKVLDARTRTSVATNATWVAVISNMAHDWLIDNTNFSGSAVVYASQDMAVMVGTEGGSRTYAYVGIPSTPSVSGIGTGTPIFVPSYMRNFYGWNSTLYVQNVGGAPTTIHARLYDPNGQEVDQDDTPYDINPGGRATFANLTGVNMGSVRVTASQPLAATVGHYHANMATAYAGFSSGGTKGYLASLMKNFYGWDSSYVAQETVRYQEVKAPVTYYSTNENEPPISGITTLDLKSWEQETVWMGGLNQLPTTWIGSAQASRNPGSYGLMAFAVHQASATGAQAFHGAQAGARDLYVPFLQQVAVGESGWSSSLTVQNVGTSSANVTVYFYNMSGGGPVSPYSFNLKAGYSRVLCCAQLPTGQSSAWVDSTRDVVAVVQMSHSDNGRALSYAVP